jgi:protein-L-isoaspartate(D-aspartate) O-methyltransferase
MDWTSWAWSHETFRVSRSRFEPYARGMDKPIEDVRREYAMAVASAAGVSRGEIIEALAEVPRERFLFAGPWARPRPDANEVENTPDADPRHVYVDRLISLDAAKNLNNGVPSFWAGLFEHLKPQPGERAIHAGAGTGYYSAILAHLVGPTGRVLAIEYEPHLAAHAQGAFAEQPNVEVLQGDALALASGAADVIVASAGLDAVPLSWVRLLNDGGRMLIPLTAPAPQFGERIGGGAMLLVTRRGLAYGARFVSGTFVYHFMAGRSDAASERLRQAFSLSSAPPHLASLRLDDQPDDSAWVIGDGWWLSTAAA